MRKDRGNHLKGRAAPVAMRSWPALLHGSPSLTILCRAGMPTLHACGPIRLIINTLVSQACTTASPLLILHMPLARPPPVLDLRRTYFFVVPTPPCTKLVWHHAWHHESTQLPMHKHT